MKKILIAVVVLAVIVSTVGAITLFAAPGDSNDPIITLSYVEDVVKKELSFQVVNMNKGDVLIGEAGTEVILRMGNAEVIATEKGGLADLTAGADLADGTNMPANHHLVIPVDDGRGIKAKDKVIVMVKGDFTLE
ncbi:MAG: hypothetical protein IKV86_01350 [Clostridia bacterium]|nr:hypothetical protein [Clostridia bacterium]